MSDVARTPVSLSTSARISFHSFAVHMLALLIRQRSGEVSKDEDLSGAIYRRLLAILAAGAALARAFESATTYIYLDHLAGCQDTVDAVEELLSGIETPLVLRGAHEQREQGATTPGPASHSPAQRASHQPNYPILSPDCASQSTPRTAARLIDLVELRPRRLALAIGSALRSSRRRWSARQ